MKKVMVSTAVLVMFVFLAGCLDYKAYDVPKEEATNEDTSLVDEIAQIEKELDLEQNKTTAELDEEELNVEETDSAPKEVEEEVVLPELEKEKTDENTNSDLETIAVKENELVKLKIKVSDPDKDIVTYTFGKPLNKQGEWKTKFGDAGEYLVKVSATDGKLTTEKNVKIVVERVNVAPVIDLLKDLLVNEGQTVKFEPKVTDPNHDPVSVTVSEPLKGGTFVTDHTSAGEYVVTVTASDGELETEKSFKLIVKDVNMLPEITGLKDITVKEGEVVKIEPTVTDLDGDKVYLTISDPVGNDGVWETAYTNHGGYIVVVTADDGKDKVTKNVKITVEDVNMPPEIVDVSLDLKQAPLT